MDKDGQGNSPNLFENDWIAGITMGQNEVLLGHIMRPVIRKASFWERRRFIKEFQNSGVLRIVVVEVHNKDTNDVAATIHVNAKRHRLPCETTAPILKIWPADSPEKSMRFISHTAIYAPFGSLEMLTLWGQNQHLLQPGMLVEVIGDAWSGHESELIDGRWPFDKPLPWINRPSFNAT